MASRYPVAVSLKKDTSEVELEPMLQFVYRFGYPYTLLTDNGSNFTSKLMTAVCSKLEIKRITTSPCHPQSNESWHGTLKTMLRKTNKGKTEWNQLLAPLLFAYRDSVHEATGFTPFQLLFRREVKSPLKLVRQQWEDKQTHLVSVHETSI